MTEAVCSGPPRVVPGQGFCQSGSLVVPNVVLGEVEGAEAGVDLQGLGKQLGGAGGQHGASGGSTPPSHQSLHAFEVPSQAYLF